MSEVRVNNLSNESLTGGPTISGITTFSSPYFFVPPQGDTASRPSGCPNGSLRFNTDSAKLEYYKGDTIGWIEIEASNDELGGGTEALGIRGLFAAGQVAPSTGSYTNHIEFLTISTLGNGETFGDLTAVRSHCAGMANRTRCVFGSGYGPSNVIDFISISSTGNAQDFGDNTTQADSTAGASSQTRGLIAGGSSTNTISYITIAQTGNAVDFGDLTRAHNNMAGASSSTRGVFAGGGASDNEYNTIDFVTIATTGNASDFGDLTYTTTTNCAGGSNSTRMIVAGGADTPSYSMVNNIDFLTIATTGNASDFGDLTVQTNACGAMTSPTRCVIKLGVNGPGNSTTTNVIDFIQFTTTGNSTDFGDSVNQTYGVGEGISNGHGGL
jgi:hypothetical protein